MKNETKTAAKTSRYPLAGQYTALQFNELPAWARDTILSLEQRQPKYRYTESEKRAAQIIDQLTPNLVISLGELL